MIRKIIPVEAGCIGVIFCILFDRSLLPQTRIIIGALCIFFFCTEFQAQNTPIAETPVWVYAQIASIRHTTSSTNHLAKVIFRIRVGPVGFPKCIQTQLSLDRDIGTHIWLRVRSHKRGLCPYASVIAEPEVTPARLHQIDTNRDIKYQLYETWTRGKVLDRRARMEPVVERLYQSGMGHVLAISGLHVGLVYVLLSRVFSLGLFIVPWVVLSRAPHHFVVMSLRLLALVGTWTLLFKWGLPASGMRAGLFISLLVVARDILGRTVRWDHLLITMCVTMAIFDIAQVYTFSFLLSITAVCYLYPLTVVGRRLKPIFAAVLPWLGTAPLISLFADVHLFSPLANIVGLPFFSMWVFPVAFFAEVANWLELHVLSQGLYDCFRYGVWLLDSGLQFFLQQVPEYYMNPSLGGRWPQWGYILWLGLPVLCTNAFRRGLPRIALSRWLGR